MADGDWENWDDIDLGDDEDESDDAEGAAADSGDEPDVNERIERLERATGKVIKKMKGDQEKEAAQLRSSFLADASDEEKDLADVFDLDSLTSRRQVEKAIDKIRARAAKLNPEGHIGTGDAFAPPVAGRPPVPKSDDDKLTEKLHAGKVSIGDFLETFANAPTGEWSYKD